MRQVVFVVCGVLSMNVDGREEGVKEEGRRKGMKEGPKVY